MPERVGDTHPQDEPSSGTEPVYAGPPDPPAADTGPGRARLALAGVIVMIGVAAALGARARGFEDSALLFVGVPLVTALAVTLFCRPRSGSGLAYLVVTVVLLLVSALFVEASVCVLMIAPLVYGVTALTVWLARASAGDPRRLALVPVVGLVALEGVVPGARVAPVQTVSETVTTSSTCQAVAARIEHPVIPAAADRGLLLRLFPYPTPTAATGDGLAVGDHWSLTMPQGPLETTVTQRADDRVAFAVVADHSRVTRWVDVRSGDLSWRPDGSGCRVTLTVTWERKLDPSWYFGPVNQVFVGAGAHAFVTALVGPDAT